MFENKDNIIKKTIVVSAGTKEIPIGAYNNENISVLKLPEGLEKIGAYAFANNRIKSLEIPSTVEEIGMDSFAMNDIETVAFKEGIEEIPSEAFYKNNISRISLPNSLKKIGRNAFSKNNLTKVVIPSNVYEIEKNAFDNIDVEYRGILITKEEIEKYGCENIISLMREKKAKLRNENKALSDEAKNVKEEEKEKEVSIPLDSNSDELVDKILLLAAHEERRWQSSINELKAELRLLSSSLKSKYTSLKNIEKYKEELVSFTTYLASLGANSRSDFDITEKMHIINAIEKLASARVKGFDVDIANLNSDIEELCMKIRGVQMQIRKQEETISHVTETKEYLSGKSK